MKKFYLIMILYTALSFAFSLLYGAFFVNIPVLLQGTENSYKFFSSLLFFLKLLPAVFLSGYIAICAIIWQKTKKRVSVRFSAAMFERFTHIFISSLIATLVLTLNMEFFIPQVKGKIHSIENASSDVSNAIAATKSLMAQEKPLLAIQFATRALKLSPDSEYVRSIYKKALDFVDACRDRNFSKNSQKDEDDTVVHPLHDEDSKHSIVELLALAKSCAERKEWFPAHYWAQLAVQACDEKNTVLPEASHIANEAWKMLSYPLKFDNSKEREYYLLKKDGYSAYNSGDYLKAYFIFITLNTKYERGKDDPDVKKFFELTKEQVENDYFFYDEVQNIKEFSNSSKVYFTLTYPDKSRDVVFIDNSMDIKREGKLVKYVEGLFIARYAATGNFMYSMKVPCAKVTAIPVSSFSDDAKIILGIDGKWKYVPQITLQAVERSSGKIISKPEYNLLEENLPSRILEKNSMKSDGQLPVMHGVTVPPSSKNTLSMILPMTYDDLNIIADASAGAGNMGLWNLKKFLPKVESYGFSKEVFAESFVQRVTYPFMILIMFIFCATMGWNYRIVNPKTVFHFNWLFLFPVYCALTAVIFSCVEYMFTLMNYCIVGLFGNVALLVAFVVYAIMLFASSALFVSRKD